MEFVPWSSFARIVAQYGGDGRAPSFLLRQAIPCNRLRAVAYRESLRDIEACLAAHAAKLYGLGFHDPVRRATLADANEAKSTGQQLKKGPKTFAVDAGISASSASERIKAAEQHRDKSFLLRFSKTESLASLRDNRLGHGSVNRVRGPATAHA